MTWTKRLVGAMRSFKPQHPKPGQSLVPRQQDSIRDYPSAGLTPSRLITILREADAGSPASMFALFEDMEEKDAHLYSVAQTRRLALTGLPWQIVSANNMTDTANQKLADQAADYCRHWLNRCDNFDDTLQHLSLAVGRNIAMSEIIWDVIDAGLRPVDFITVDFARIVFDEFDNPKLLTADHDREGITPPPHKFIIHTPHSVSGHPQRGGTYASPNGRAPAAGWIKRIIAETGVGLFAEIEWTQQAKEMLAAKQYRYLSPVAIIRKSDRKLTAIHSAALTNKPAIVGMTPIVNTQSVPTDAIMSPMWDQLRHTLSLPLSIDIDQLLVAASERIDQLEAQHNQQHTQQRIDQAMHTGKLTEALKPWAAQLIAKDETLFDNWLALAPVMVSLGRSNEQNNESWMPSKQHTISTSARAEFRANPILASLTTEEAYMKNAARSHATVN